MSIVSNNDGMKNDLITRIERIKDRMAAACLRAGRHPNDVRLLLATKTVPADRIKMVLAAGETLLGENKVQELRKAVRDRPVGANVAGLDSSTLLGFDENRRCA